MLKILTIGGAMQDLFLTFKHLPETIAIDRKTCTEHCIVFPEGQKIEVTQIQQWLGGGAVNTAVSFKRLGFAVTSFFKIGNDGAGQFIVNELRNQEINIDSVVYTDQALTGTSFILPAPSGNRVCLAYRGANLTLVEQDLPWDIIKEHAYLYITSLNGYAAFLLPIIAHDAKSVGSFIATNPGTHQLTDHIIALINALPYIDLLIINCHEASLLSRSFGLKNNIGINHAEIALTTPEYCFSLNQLFKELLARGPRMAVVTNGADGVYATDGHNIYFHPVIPTNVVSTLGAGDAFGSAFTAAIIQEHSILYALQTGMLNSTHVLQHANTQTGLLHHDEMTAKQKKLDQSIIKIVAL